MPERRAGTEALGRAAVGRVDERTAIEAHQKLTGSYMREIRERRKWVFYYDGDCEFCSRLVRALIRIDFFGGIRWLPYQTLKEPPDGLAWGDLESAAYLDTGQRRLHQGFYGIRMLTLRLLPLLPLAPFLWFPGVNLLGVAAYRWVARNRHRFSR